MTHPRAPMREGTPLRERMSQAEFDAHCKALIEKHWAKKGKDVVVVPTPDGLQSNIVGGEPLPVMRKAGKVYVQKPQQLGKTMSQEIAAPAALAAPQFVAIAKPEVPADMGDRLAAARTRLGLAAVEQRLTAAPRFDRTLPPEEHLAVFRARASELLAVWGVTLDQVQGGKLKQQRLARLRQIVIADILNEMRPPAWVLAEVFGCCDMVVFTARRTVDRCRAAWGDRFSVAQFLERPAERPPTLQKEAA